MRASIWLKFRTYIGDLKANISIKSGINLKNIQEDISDFMYKTKLKFFHVYRVSCFEEQVENQYVARLNIRGVPFGG